MTAERWLPVVGYEGYYEVSDQGRVRGLDRWIPYSDGKRPRLYRGRIMRPCINRKSGKHSVALYRCDVMRRMSVHVLALEAFVGPRPEGLLGLHWDDNAANNALSNLRWGTTSENRFDSVRNGTHTRASRTHCPQGHPYDEANTAYRANSPGWRGCRACTNRASRDLKRRKRAAGMVLR